MIVELTDTEMRIAELVCAERKRLGWPCKNNVSGQPEEVVALRYIGSQIAFAKAVGLYPPLFEDGSSVDISAFGWSIDVKCERGPDLIVKDHGPDKVYADWFALVLAKPPRFKLAGLAGRVRLMQDEYYRRDIPLPAWVMPPNKLQPFKDWLDLTEILF